MTNYAQHVSTRATPQSEPIPGKPMVPNSAGGFSFAVDDWTRLDRFLVLGNEGGSYYASEKKLTVENAQCVQRCLTLDAARTVNRIVEISDGGRAPKNDPAIFALALVAAQTPYSVTGGSKADAPARALVSAALPRVCRIPTHLFAFVEAVQELRGWGRSLRNAVADWYTVRPAGELARQVTKYQSRNGWSHRDLLRLAHPKATGTMQDVLHWAVKGWESIGADPHPNADLLPIWAMECAKRATTPAEVSKLVRDYNLPRECVPTQFLTDAGVWEALLEKMPLTALVRNLATMTRVGLLTPMSAAVGKVLAELANGERIAKARLHPIALLSALLTYQQGHGEKSAKTWTPVSQVVDALDGAFYLAFRAVEPTGKRWLLALDVSGSMGSGTIAGVLGLTPRVGSCAMALVTAAVEPQHHFVAFTQSGWGGSPSRYSGSPACLTPLTISPRQRLDDVCQQTAALPMGGTDCALPMLYAAEQKIPADVFVVFTDSETWHGKIHPTQALQQYRQKMGIPAKMIVCGMVANEFTIADRSDAGQMDMIGFDTAAPAAMADFARA